MFQTTRNSTLLQLVPPHSSSCLPSGTGFCLHFVPLLLHQATVCVLWTLFITSAQSSTCSLGFPLKSFKTKDVQYLFFQKKEDFVSEQTPFVEETVDPVFIYKM